MGAAKTKLLQNQANNDNSQIRTAKKINNDNGNNNDASPPPPPNRTPSSTSLSGGCYTDIEPITTEIKHFTIKKDKDGSFGINLVGGSDQQHIPGNSGIFVASIKRNDLKEMMNAGDRIISVNHTKLEGKTHDEAVQVFRECGQECEICIQTNAEHLLLSRRSSAADIMEEDDAESLTVSSWTSTASNGKAVPSRTHEPPFLNASQAMEFALVAIGFVTLASIAFFGYRRISRDN